MNKVFFLIALSSVTIASFSQVLLKMGAGKSYPSKIREYLNFYVIINYHSFPLLFSFPSASQ